MTNNVAEGMNFNEVVLSPQYCVDRNGDTVYVGDDRSELRWGDSRDLEKVKPS